MRAHVIGGGLAGLAASWALAEAGHPVTLYEAGPVCGGRCRSYLDRELGRRIDNGNHLLLSGNAAAMAYLAGIGARHTLAGPGKPVFPFVDLRTGERWTVRMGGAAPWWLLDPARRVPGTRARDYLALARLFTARAGAMVAATLPDGVLYRRLLAPFAIAALNTPLDQASAVLLANVVRRSLARGGAACLPLVPAVGLSETFVDPALVRLASLGATIHTSCRVSRLDTGQRVTRLTTPEGEIDVSNDAVVLATPAPIAADLLPGLVVPDRFEAILNLHFRTDADPGEAGFVGLVGGLAEWAFVKPGLVSITISAAADRLDTPPEALAERIWPELQAALNLRGPMPAYRLIREKRATFAATPAQNARRPGTRTAYANLALAGDWTATGLPATIEGAIKSGFAAARALRRQPPRFG